jgi:hypothetical protein
MTPAGRLLSIVGIVDHLTNLEWGRLERRGRREPKG